MLVFFHEAYCIWVSLHSLMDYSYCIQELRAVNKSKICGEMDTYSFYLIIEFKDLVISKKLFDKKLDSSDLINQLSLFLNNT